MKEVQRTRSAFAALKADGTVVTWGDSVNFRSLSRFLVGEQHTFMVNVGKGFLTYMGGMGYYSTVFTGVFYR